MDGDPSRDNAPLPNWLAPPAAAEPEPLPPSPPGANIKFAHGRAGAMEPPPPGAAFSPWTVFALIGGLTVPVITWVLSAILVIFDLAGELEVEALPLVVSVVLAVGMFGFPFAWHAWQRLRGCTPIPWRARLGWVGVGGAVGVALLLGGQLAVRFNLAPEFVLGMFQPFIFIAASAGLLAMTLGGWAGMSRLQAWGHLLSGGWLAVFLSFVAEVVGAVFIAVIVFAALSVVAPDQAQQIMNLARSVSASRDVDPKSILSLVFQPWAIGLLFLGAAVGVPLLEEFFKSVGVMLLLRRRPGPMAAFAGGVMGGVGFAVVESLSNLSGVSEAWAVLVLARMGTLVMHSFTTGLVGWGWGEAARRRPVRLLAAYGGAVATHGFWNALAVMVALSVVYLQEHPGFERGPMLVLGIVAALAGLLLFLLVPACLGGLMWIGWRLRKEGQI